MKKIIKKVIFVFIFFSTLLIEEHNTTKDIYTFKNAYTNQQFKIVYTNTYFENYLKKIKENNNVPYTEIYSKEVITPIYKDCFENAEYLHLVPYLINKPPEPSTFNTLKFINKEISENKNKINENIKESLLKSSTLLPANFTTTICIFPDIAQDVRALTVGVGKIILPYNALYKNNFIKTSMAHEYNHSILTQKNGINLHKTVLDNIIFEGKAVMFEKIIYPDLVNINSDKNNYKYWKNVKEDLYNVDYERSIDIINGDGYLPPLYGYNIGYQIMKEYIKINPKQSTEKWTFLNSEDIIKYTKFGEK